VRRRLLIVIVILAAAGCSNGGKPAARTASAKLRDAETERVCTTFTEKFAPKGTFAVGGPWPPNKNDRFLCQVGFGESEKCKLGIVLWQRFESFSVAKDAIHFVKINMPTNLPKTCDALERMIPPTTRSITPPSN
jgi:hypothetical protein